VPPK